MLGRWHPAAGRLVSGRGPLRIAQVTPSLRGGGLERLVRDLALALSARGHHAAVFCLNGLGMYADELTAAGVKVYDCRAGTIRVRGYPAALVRALREFAPDVMHAHSGTWFAASVAKSRLRTPRLVFTDHGRYPPEPWLRGRIERWCHGRTDGFVAVTTALARYDRDYLALPDDPPVVLNGIDLAPYARNGTGARERLRAEWGVGREEVLALAIGRFAPVKNYEGMLRAVAQARAAAPALRLAILGSGAGETAARALSAELGLGDAVTYLGFRRDVAECLHAADLFLNASHTEALPVSLLEAMAAGVPTVAPRIGGIPDALGDPPAGLLVEPGRTEELATALVRITGDAALRAELGRLASRHARRFSLETFVDNYCAVYDSVLERRT
jgi:glycosyltransferase involved in cell wall biosynthesis